MLNSILTKIKKNCFLDFGCYHNTVFLAGSGRSGTTWVQEVINHDDTYRVMFEPFHSRKIKILKEWNYRQYLRADNRKQEFWKPAATILGGRIRDPWIDQYNTKVVVNKRLIKDIRANLFLKWIKSNFPEIPVILMLRHPCAVAGSKLKLNWDIHLDDFLSQDELMSDFLSPYKEEISSAKEMFEKHIFTWCIENYVPLTQFRPGEILVIFYEAFCMNPSQNIDNIKEFLGYPPSSSYSLDIFSKPSTMSREDSAIMFRSNLVESWRKDVNDQQIRRAIEILSLFGLERVYNEGNFPLKNGKEALELFST